MTESDRKAIKRLFGGQNSSRVSTDDLQGLLLQVVFALLMIFMIAYFIFVEQQRKARAEEVMELNRQKLTLAIEKVAEDRRIGYGLNALMTQGLDGKRTFHPDQFVQAGRIKMADAAKSAFSAGSKAAYADYSSPAALAERWRTDVFSEAGLKAEDLSEKEVAWLEKALAAEIENVRLDARGVQRALAARLQRQWIDNPKTLPGYDKAARSGEIASFASQVAQLLKAKSLELVEKETGAEVLP